MEAIRNMNGSELFGRVIKVNIAKGGSFALKGASSTSSTTANNSSNSRAVPSSFKAGMYMIYRCHSYRKLILTLMMNLFSLARRRMAESTTPARHGKLCRRFNVSYIQRRHTCFQKSENSRHFFDDDDSISSLEIKEGREPDCLF